MVQKNKRQFLPSFTPQCLQSKGGGGQADCSSVIGRNGLLGRTWPCEGGKGGGGGMRAVGRRGRRDDVRGRERKRKAWKGGAGALMISPPAVGHGERGTVAVEMDGC